MHSRQSPMHWINAVIAKSGLQVLASDRPETRIPGAFPDRNRRIQFSDCFIFKDLLPLKMVAHLTSREGGNARGCLEQSPPCAALVSILSRWKSASALQTAQSLATRHLWLVQACRYNDQITNHIQRDRFTCGIRS